MTRACALALVIVLLVLASRGEAQTTQARAEARAGGAFDAEVDPALAIASASLFGVTSFAEFRIDPDDQDIELRFSVTPGPGGFDSTVLATAFARGDAFVITSLTAAGVAAGPGTVQFLFTVTGRMDIDGTPFPGGDPRYHVGNFNQLRVRVGPPGNPVTELIFDEAQAGAAATQVFTTLVGTSAIPVDFSDPVELTIEWQGGASVQFADGDFTVSSDFLGTVGLRGAVLRDLAGNRIAGNLVTEGGRVLPVPAPAGGGLAALAGLAVLAARGRRRWIGAAAAAALLVPAAARAAVEVDFTGFGAYTAEAFGACRVQAMSDGDALVSLGSGGLGVQGSLGTDAGALDGGESLLFVFPAFDNLGATGISYRVSVAGDENANGSAGEAFLEAFGEQNQSLGVRAVSGAGTIDVSALFAGVPIQFLRLVAAGDSQQIDRLRFTPAATSGTFLHLDGFGFVITPLFELCEVAISGSSDVVLTALGLGISGGASPSLLDGFEWVRFDFERPQTSVFYTSTDATDANGSGLAGDGFVEAYGAGGASLGLVAVSGDGTRDVTALFGGALLSGFRVVANVDAQRLSAVIHVPEGDATAGGLSALAVLLLARRARRRLARAASCTAILAALWLGAAPARAAPLLTIPCACVVAGGAGPGHVVVGPDDRHVYFGFAAALSGWERDPTTGTYGAAVSVEAVAAGVRKSAFSPDGRHLYAAVDSGNSLIVLLRDLASGSLGIVETITDGVGGVDGLQFVRDVAVSPDGKHVYAVSAGEDAIAAFARNADTGALTFVEAERDGVSGVDGLDGAFALALSPDGRHVYVASALDDAVAVFARDATSGALAFVEDRRDGVAGFDGLLGARDVVVSRDGRGVFVLGAAEAAIAVLSRNPVTGSLGFVEVERNGVAGVANFAQPTALALDPRRPRVFATSRTAAGSGNLQIFDFDAGAGTLVRSYTTPAGAEDLAVARDGRHLYRVAGAASVPPDAIAPLRFAGRVKEGEGGAQGLGSPIDLAVAGRSLYVASSAEDALAVLARSGAGGLSFAQAVFDGAAGVTGLDGPFGVVASPDGRHLYAASIGAGAIVRFARDAGTGALSFAEALFDGTAGISGLAAVNGISASPDGAHLYTTSGTSAGENAVVAFARNGQTGGLTFVGVWRDGVGVVDGIEGARSPAVSPDGANVYVAGLEEDAVAVFARNPATGALGFVELERSGVGGVTGLERPYDLAVSPDGRHVYVASRGSDAVAAFGRAPGNGALTFLESVTVPGALDLPTALAIAPDGRLVVAVGQASDSLVVFWRDPESGRLGLAQVEVDDVALVDGLRTPSDVAIAGRSVYVTSFGDEAVAVFVPEPEGALLASAALAALLAVGRRGAGRP